MGGFHNLVAEDSR